MSEKTVRNGKNKERYGANRNVPFALHRAGRIQGGFNGKEPERAIKMNKNIQSKKRRLEKTGWQYKVMGRREVWGLLGK